MSDVVDALILDMLEWIAREPRTYGEALEAWRTSCPRLTVWEDAVDRGFVERIAGSAGGARVALTASGREFLAGSRRVAAPTR
jgi:hypothetical protein